jgi:hypothetical protein
MPCPAEYNFFFTHDLLLTDLGGVLFDLHYVKNGYHFLHSLTKEDSVLPHAYYWKDDVFKTEFCKTDNWNHLWFIITVSSYLKHSADKKTVALLYPIVRKSLKMMLENKGDDDLMYASRPDWWDTGNSYGARVYITTLMIKVLKDYVFIASALGISDEDLIAYLELAERMKTELVERLWDDNIGFLMNMLDQTRRDDHYYSGSIVAAYLEVLDNAKRTRLLETAREKLLDNNIGIRNAMPADFHKLIDVYQFQGMEMGEPYFYFNGGVWPHGNAWYALGLLANEQPDKAKDVIKKYLTLGGITHSPNGQPSFYEFRITDRASPRYGEIDKPSFLWAGGWYLHALYQLAGLRENSWNIFFSPILPQGFENVEYDLTLFGDLCRIKWHGQGDYFRRITIDGQNQYSAVTVSSARNITLERGIPETPYLAEAHCLIKDVSFSSFDKELTIKFWGIIGQIADLMIISPYQLQKSELNEMEFHDGIHGSNLDDVYTYIIKVKLNSIDNEMILGFK